NKWLKLLAHKYLRISLPETGDDTGPAAGTRACAELAYAMQLISQRNRETMATKLDILFVNPSSRMPVYQSLGNDLAAVENPVWAGLLASFCRRRGLVVEILDAEAEDLAPSQVAERVAVSNPLLVAVVVYRHQPSASTPT